MRKYKIIFAPIAEKQFMQLTRVVRIRVAQAIAKLADEPFLGKQLKGQLKDYRSYRVGDYRVIYFIRHHQIQVEIIRVAHRKEAYK
ncbi:MAG: type II toxin-antitoxin system mRNA interferase toxin, RelE/StbE family [Pseudomonadota bacterium]